MAQISAQEDLIAMLNVKNYSGEIIKVPEQPLTVRDTGGCICPSPWRKDGNSEWVWNINPSCQYHASAAQQPWNHRIPWNCPTFYDGCNCDDGPYFPIGEVNATI
jgi:hypothetical protein